MKILMQIRPDYHRNPAGDTVQMISTALELKKSGVEIAISTDPNILLEPFDLVHIFNLTRVKESYLYFLNAQKQKKKTVVSPVYWNPRFFLLREGGNPNDMAAWKLAQPMRARVLRECDLLLPNGQHEVAGLKQDFPAIAPYRVIPNGFPDAFLTAGPAAFRTRYPDLPAEFVLSVARISARKNQHWLARICQELDLSLVLIGPVNDRKYFEQVRSFPNVTYLGVHQGDLLASAYASAKVHALPSWFETPGLSSLEAAACGTTVITTDQGCTYEYFKEMALYVRPADDESLRTALEQALTFSPIPLTDHIRKHYSWSHIAQATLSAYQSLV